MIHDLKPGVLAGGHRRRPERAERRADGSIHRAVVGVVMDCGIWHVEWASVGLIVGFSAVLAVGFSTWIDVNFRRVLRSHNEVIAAADYCIEKLAQRVYKAEAERDAWRGRKRMDMAEGIIIGGKYALVRADVGDRSSSSCSWRSAPTTIASWRIISTA